MILSAGRTPASSAGPPGVGATTTISASLSPYAISTPTPVMLALIVLSVSSAYFSGSRNRVNGSSSFASIARIASYVSSVESIGVRFTVSSRYLNQETPLNVLSTYALSTARHASRNSRLLAVMASDAGAAKPPTHAATAAAAAAAAAPRRARANTDTEKSASRASDKPTGLSNASVSPSVPKLFLAGRDARAATRARREGARARIPAGSATGAQAARRIAARRRVRVGCGGSSFPGRAARSGTLRVLLSAYVAATVSPDSWQGRSPE